MENLPRRKSVRLKEYDYSKAGYYHVTVCTYERKELFGHIKDDQMFLNKCGKIVEETWKEIPEHYPDVKLDEFKVMPNHIHGIIIIDNFVGDGHARPANLSTIIGSYKSAVTKQINRLSKEKFKWQRFFYDHVMRAEESLEKIREYVKYNPSKWDEDENNIKNYKETGQACLTPTEYGSRTVRI